MVLVSSSMSCNKTAWVVCVNRRAISYDDYDKIKKGKI